MEYYLLFGALGNRWVLPAKRIGMPCLRRASPDEADEGQASTVKRFNDLVLVVTHRRRVA